MTRSVRLALLAAFALGVSGAGTAAPDEAPLRPDDFAWGRTIELHRAAPLQTLLLDLQVYRGSVEPGLADLRVMNAAGEPVPHAVRRLPRPTPEGEDVALPFFALYPSPAEAGDAAGTVVHGEASRAGETGRSYSIRAEVSESGAIVEVDSRPAADATAPDRPPPPAYLLDASQLDRAVGRLELELAAGVTGFVVPVRVEGSDDLNRFVPLGRDSVVARLEQQGHRIEKRHVELGASRHAYLRISWPAAPLPVRITGVRATLEPARDAPPRDRVRVAGRPLPEEPGAFLFDLGGGLPVDRVQILLPETNTLVQARIYSGAAEAGPWQLRHEGLLYDLEYGERLRNPEIPWPPVRHRYVKLGTSPIHGALGGGAPALEARWLPEQLLFITRGEPPYQLVYGRHDAPAPPFDASEILTAREDPNAEPPRETAALGDEHPVGDPSVTEPRVRPPYRKWALWAVLVIVVGTVLTLSVSLARQMRSRGSDRERDEP